MNQPHPMHSRHIAFVALLAVACMHGDAQPSPNGAESAAAPSYASRSSPATRDERWRADLRYLAAELPARHVDMYRFTTPEAFARAVAALDSAIPRLSDSQIQLRFLRLAAMVRDGHTGVQQPHLTQRLPIEVFWVDDGPYIVGATAPYSALVGQRIVGMDGHPISDVADTLRRYLPYENEMGFRNSAASAILAPRVLRDMGLADDSTTVTVDLAARGGERSQVTLPAVATAGFAVQLPAGGTPLYRRRRGAKYWLKYLPEDRTVFIKYNKCRDAGDFRRLVDSVAVLLDRRHARRVVVDLRDNTGGNSRVINPLIALLQARPNIDRPDALYAIIGRRTFSSGTLAADDFRKKTRATIIGEPIGERPNSFGEVRTFQLPYSGLTVRYSTKFFRLVDGNPDAFYPDVSVPPTIESLVAGRDPAMAWIRAQH